MDDEEVRRRRATLRSEIGVLLEAHRRLVEAEAVHMDAAQPEPSTGRDDSQLAAGNVVASLHNGDPIMATDDDDFYPLDEPEFYSAQQLDDARWLRRLFTEGFGDIGVLDDTREAASGYHGNIVHSYSDPYDDDDVSRDHIDQAIVSRRLHIPHISYTPVVLDEANTNNQNDGFGGVPASASAIAGLKKQKYDGSGADSMCVICMRDYKKGKRLVVMPCDYTHRFHRKCLKKWLSRSHLCPLCRHALPTEDKIERRSTNVSM